MNITTVFGLSSTGTSYKKMTRGATTTFNLDVSAICAINEIDQLQVLFAEDSGKTITYNLYNTTISQDGTVTKSMDSHFNIIDSKYLTFRLESQETINKFSACDENSLTKMELVVTYKKDNILSTKIIEKAGILVSDSIYSSLAGGNN